MVSNYHTAAGRCGKHGPLHIRSSSLLVWQEEEENGMIFFPLLTLDAPGSTFIVALVYCYDRGEAGGDRGDVPPLMPSQFSAATEEHAAPGVGRSPSPCSVLRLEKALLLSARTPSSLASSCGGSAGNPPPCRTPETLRVPGPHFIDARLAPASFLHCWSKPVAS